MRRQYFFYLLLLAAFFASCSKNDGGTAPTNPVDTVSKKDTSFLFGTDLSFANQVADFGGVFKDNGVQKTVYEIVRAHGHNTVRVRLWHNPTWTKTVYGTAGKQLYSNLADAEKTIRLAKAQGMKVLLDFHYSDTWADPDKQEIPAAWKDIKDITILKDSVYQYTLATLNYLKSNNLMPELVQLGNETNCGMLYTNAATGFPDANACNGKWQNLGLVLNAGIKAVRDANSSLTVKTKIILHVADPKNVEWWFDNIKTQAAVTDFDMIGFSYYPIWHKTIAVSQLAATVASFKSRYSKDVVLLETAYPWTETGNDSYTNHFGPGAALAGYVATQQGQYDILKDITQAVITGGGKGVFYWEPDWISVPGMKDLWGEGSAWENCAFFDYSSNPVKAIDYPKYDFTWK